MKRSEVNKVLVKAIRFIKEMRVSLPPFAFWLPEEWMGKGHEYDEIRDNMLGWDITDFGMNKFLKLGRTVFTLRNGNSQLKQYKKVYAEKLLVLEEEQRSPIHFHRQKSEDIINRGGGNIMIRVYQATTDGDRSNLPLEVSIDGRRESIKAGDVVQLKPGESIFIPAFTVHEFWSEKGTGLTLSGEVSSVNNDRNDNYFLSKEARRFPDIEKDEPPLHLLCNEYPPVKG